MILNKTWNSSASVLVYLQLHISSGGKTACENKTKVKYGAQASPSGEKRTLFKKIKNKVTKTLKDTSVGTDSRRGPTDERKAKE